MKRKNSTRNALVTSVISLLLCVSMLVGTTFAWFTDEVTIGGNKIASGTLDIELHELTDEGWKDISNSEDPLFNWDKWEPGYTQAIVLKVKNAGTLALNWAASITPISAETVTALANAIDVYVLEGATTAPASFADIQGTYTRVGTLREFMTNFAANTVGALEAGNEATLGIALHMQEEAGNDYQGLSLGSDFDIRIFATQRSNESDSFGSDYDTDSKYPANYEVATNVYVNTSRNEAGTVTGASVANSTTINLGTQSNAVVTTASVTIPEGTAVDHTAVNEDGTVELKASIKEADDVPANITISNDQEALPLEIKVDGLAENNNTFVTVYTNIGAGRNNVALYHNTTPMKSLSTSTNAPTEESFYYDKATGDLYIYAKSFSPFTIVNDSAHAAVIGSTYYATLKEAIAAAKDGDTINLLKNVTGDVTITQQPGVSFTINGNGKTFNGVITVDGKSARYATAGLTIKNVKFDATDISTDACIRLGHINAARYTNNVTVQNCTFSGTGNNKVAIKSYTGGDWNLTIDGCTVNNGMHSLAQLKNVEQNLIVKNCNVYSKNGLNLNNGNNLAMSNCTFDVQGYAVRFGESANTTDETFTITDSVLKSACAEDGDAVIEFRKGAVNATLNLNNTTLDGTTTFKGNTADTKILVDGARIVSTMDELSAAVNAGAKLIDAQGANLGDFSYDAVFTDGAVIKNAKFTYFYGGGVNGTVTFENCEFVSDHSYSANFDNGNGNIIFNNCLFDGWSSFGTAITNVEMNNCTFQKSYNYGVLRFYQTAQLNSCTFADNFEGIDTNATGYKVEFANCTGIDGKIYNNGSNKGIWVVDGTDISDTVTSW